MSQGAAITAALQGLPDAPGVYRFYDADDALLYVGKAKRLRARVRSYFRAGGSADHRMRAHVGEIARLEWETTRDEATALAREGELIAALQPRYNVADREGRRSTFLRLTAGAYPSLEVAFSEGPGQAGPDDEIYGPYRTTAEARRVLRAAERHFRVRTCALAIPPDGGALARACLLGELGQCLAPCLPGQDATTQAAYAGELALLRSFLRGDRFALLARLTAAMEAAAEAEDFEAAARLRDQREAINRLPAARLARAGRVGDPTDSSEASRGRATSALRELCDWFAIAGPPSRILCFDVATIGGAQTTGACGVAVDGIITPREERTYALGDFDEPDDLRAHGAIAKRVVAAIADGRLLRPDLLLIDGGLPQVEAYLRAFADAALPCPSIGGIMKGPDRLIRSDGSIVEADRHAPGLLVAGAIRDRAHRRANGLHRIRRSRAVLPTRPRRTG